MRGRASALGALAIILVASWLLPAIQPTPAEASVASFSGHGNTTTGFFFLSTGLVTATYTHNGSSNFIVHAIDSSGQDTLFLANEIGVASGTRSDRARFSTNYLLTIQADGDWTITLDQPHPTSAPPAPQTYGGHSRQITSFVQLYSGIITVRATHNGHSNFIVHLVDTNGSIEEFVFNEIGAVNGSKAFGLGTSGIYFFDVDADGDWTLTVEQTTGVPTATFTQTLTPTVTNTPTATQTFTPTATATFSTCSPRPQVSITTVRSSNTLIVTIASKNNSGTSANALQALTFGTIRNATVIVTGVGQAQSGQRIALPSRPQVVTLTVASLAGQAAFVPFKVTDACGDWSTFVGAGPSGVAR